MSRKLISDWKAVVQSVRIPQTRSQEELLAAKVLCDRLCPAHLLIYLRDRSPVSLEAICQHFEIHFSSHPLHARNYERIVELLEGFLSTRLISYRERLVQVTPLLGKIQNSLGISLTAISDQYAAHSADDARDLIAITPHVARATIGLGFRADLIQSLDELVHCVRNSCHIATLCLCGKVLEICLKRILLSEEIKYQENFTIGELIGAIPKGRADFKYIDPAFTEIANLIRKSRNPAVHAKVNIPVPSREQAQMVIAATLDTLRRTFNIHPHTMGT